MQIKFISLNLWTGGKLFNQILQFLKKEKPDILALQEAYNGTDLKLDRRHRSFEIIKDKLGYPYGVFSPAVIDVTEERRIEQGNPILSKFPILESEVIFFDVPLRERTKIEGPGDFSFTPRNMQHALIDAGKTKLNVFNTQGIWGRDGNDTERRIKLSKTILEKIKGKKNVVVAGDFNIWPETKAIEIIEKELVNIFKGKLDTTFNAKRKPMNFNPLVVDYVFKSKNLKVLECYCPQVDISDHFPIAVVFDI